MKIKVLKEVRFRGKKLNINDVHEFSSKEEIKDAKYLCLISAAEETKEEITKNPKEKTTIKVNK